jgi:hypothetical protein
VGRGSCSVYCTWLFLIAIHLTIFISLVTYRGTSDYFHITYYEYCTHASFIGSKWFTLCVSAAQKWRWR